MRAPCEFFFNASIRFNTTNNNNNDNSNNNVIFIQMKPGVFHVSNQKHLHFLARLFVKKDTMNDFMFCNGSTPRYWGSFYFYFDPNYSK